MFSWKVFVLISVLSIASHADMTTNIQNMDVMSQAKLCATAQTVNSYYGYNPIKFDSEDVTIEKVQIQGKNLLDLQSYVKALKDFNIAEGKFFECLEKNSQEIEDFNKSVSEGWVKGTRNSTFTKGKKLVNIKASQNILSQELYNELRSLNLKNKGNTSDIINQVYLSDDEYESIISHAKSCLEDNNEEKCKKNAKTLAGKLYSNFIYTAYMTKAFYDYSNSKSTKLINKRCGAEEIAKIKAFKQLDKNEVVAINSLKNLGLNVQWIDETKAEAVSELLDGVAHILRFNYKPSSEKLKKINSDLISTDDEIADRARLLKSSINEPTIMFYRPIDSFNRGFLSEYIHAKGFGGPADECNSEDVRSAYNNIRLQNAAKNSSKGNR